MMGYNLAFFIVCNVSIMNSENEQPFISDRDSRSDGHLNFDWMLIDVNFKFLNLITDF
jgi:hypothetical protein